MRLLPLPAASLIAAAAVSGFSLGNPTGFIEWPEAVSGEPPPPAASSPEEPGQWFPHTGPATRRHADSLTRAAGPGTGIPAVDAWYGWAPARTERKTGGTELEDWVSRPPAYTGQGRRGVVRTGVPEVDAWYGLIPNPAPAVPKRVGTELSEWLGRKAASASGRPAPAAAGHGDAQVGHEGAKAPRIHGKANPSGAKEKGHASERHGASHAADGHGDSHTAGGHGDSHASDTHGKARAHGEHASGHASAGQAGSPSHDGHQEAGHGPSHGKAARGDSHAKDSHGGHAASEGEPALPPRPDTAFARAYDWEQGEAEVLEYAVRLPGGEAAPSARGRLVTERLFLRRDGTVARRASSKDDSDILQASLALAWEDGGLPNSVQTVSQLPRRGLFSLIRQEQARQGGPGTGHRSLDCRVAPPRLRIASSGSEAPVDTALPRWPVYTEEMLFTYLRALPLKPGYREEAWIQDWSREGRLDANARYAAITVRSRAPGVRDMDTWYLTVDRDDGRRSEYWVSASGLHPVVVARLADGSEWSLKGIARKPQRNW